MEYAKGGDVPACERGDGPLPRDQESHVPRDPFLVAAYHSSAPRAAGGAAQRCASTRAHSPAPAPPRDPTNAFGWRARTPPPLRRARFFSPLRPAGASSVTELRRKQVHSAEVGSARPDPRRGNRCERRAFRNATPPRPGQDSATPRTRTHLRLGGTGSGGVTQCTSTPSSPDFRWGFSPRSRKRVARARRATPWRFTRCADTRRRAAMPAWPQVRGGGVAGGEKETPLWPERTPPSVAWQARSSS